MSRIILTVFSGTLLLSGFVVVAWFDWRIAIGLFLVMWGNNLNNNLDGFRLPGDEDDN